MFCLPTKLLDRISMPLLIAACALLVMVLIPGLGYVVNGSRRWIRLLAFNFQVSELTRVFVLIYVASYAVRRSEELRGTFSGLAEAAGPAHVHRRAAARRAGLRRRHRAVRHRLRRCSSSRARGFATRSG